MELQYHGDNCLTLATKKARLVVDDNKTVAKEGNILLFTGQHSAPAATPKLVIDTPGEFEVSDISITGVAARSHTDLADQKSAVIYKIIVDDVRLAVVGHIHPDLKDDQLEAIGMVDILVLPVGGGDTLDGAEASKVIKKIEPKMIIPTSYASQSALDGALKELGIEVSAKTDKLKPKPIDFTDITQLVVLERQ